MINIIYISLSWGDGSQYGRKDSKNLLKGVACFNSVVLECQIDSSAQGAHSLVYETQQIYIFLSSAGVCVCVCIYIIYIMIYIIYAYT